MKEKKIKTRKLKFVLHVGVQVEMEWGVDLEWHRLQLYGIKLLWE